MTSSKSAEDREKSFTPSLWCKRAKAVEAHVEATTEESAKVRRAFSAEAELGVAYGKHAREKVIVARRRN